MAVVAGGSLPLNMDTLSLSRLYYGTITATPTAISVRYTSLADAVFTGSFTYTGNALAGGTMTGFHETYAGSVVYQVSGLNMPALTVYNHVVNGSTSALFQTALGSNDVMFGSGQADLFRSYDGDDLVFGNDGADTLYGGADVDQLYGNLGSDRLFGDAGGDALFGGQGSDYLAGGTGADTMYGNMADDTMLGDAGNDVLFGGQGADVLSGGEGNDYLLGNLGDDTMTGGGDADFFALREGGGADVLTDFSAAAGDRVHLAAGASYTVATSTAGQAVVTLSTGDTLTLVGVTPSAVQASWFLIG